MPIELIAFLFLILICGYYFISQITNYKRLGKRLLPARGGMTGINIISIFFLSISVVYFFASVASGVAQANALSTVLLAVSVLLVGLMTTTQLIWKKGFYENGIQCNSLCLPYSQVSIYFVDEGAAKAKITFNNNGKYFSGPFVEVDLAQLKEAKALLKKNCSFKNNPIKRR